MLIMDVREYYFIVGEDAKRLHIFGNTCINSTLTMAAARNERAQVHC